MKKRFFLFLAIVLCLTACNMEDIEDILNNIKPNENIPSENLGNESQEPESFENEEVLKIIGNTIYANNISANFCMIDDDGNQLSETWSLNIEKDNLNARISSKEEPSINFYLRDSKTGCEVYENGKYQKVMDVNPNLYTMMPFPSFDNISYTNYGIYQDGVGQMTNIIASNINQMYYDSETGFYKIDAIHIEHGKLDTQYMTEADKLTFSYWVKLSKDKTYVETLIFDIIESEVGLDQIKAKLSFYNYNSTKVEELK